MKKRILSALLALVMIFCLAGCATEPETPSTGAYTPSLPPDDPETWLTHKKVTLKVLTYEGSSSEYPVASNDLPFWSWLEEYTNVHIEWEIAPTTGYDEVMTTRLGAGVDLPDIVMVRTLANAEKAGSNGVLVDMAPYWETHFTNANAYWKEQGVDFNSQVINADGKIHALIGMAQPEQGHITLIYNTDWLEKLDAEIPTTLDEFTALLEKMQAAGDLNGNGKDDEIYFTADSIKGLMSGFGPTFGLEQYEGWDPFVADENDVVSCEYVSDNQKAYFKYMNELYEKGLLDQEITSMDSAALAEKVAADRVGVFCYYSSFAVSYGQLTPRAVAEGDPLGQYFTLGVALDSEYNGNDGFFVRRERAVGCPTAITKECENIDVACRWLDTLYADPMVLNVRTYGIYGEDWKYDANGEIELIHPADGSLRDIASKGCGQITLCYFSTPAMTESEMGIYTWYMDDYDYMHSNSSWRSPSVVHLQLYSAEETEIINLYKVDMESTYDEFRAKFITGQLDVDAEWDNYVSTMSKIGVDELVKAWQSIHDRTK